MKIKFKKPNPDNLNDLFCLFLINISFLPGFVFLLISFLDWNLEILGVGIRGVILGAILYIIFFVRYEK